MWILAIVFVAFFISIVLVGSAFSAGNAQEVKQTTSRLEALTPMPLTLRCKAEDRQPPSGFCWTKQEE
jgi:hypothetical protein